MGLLQTLGIAQKAKPTLTRSNGRLLAATRQRNGRSMFVSDELQRSAKSISYSDYVNDFINNTGFYEGAHYTDQQVEAAYRTSVYLFAVLRRVANLFSEVRIVGEERQDDNTWQRLPDTHPLNMIFSAAGSAFMREMFLYYAVYGRTLIYKRKTRLAKMAYRQGKIIANYADGGIAGVHIIPNSKWDMQENEYRSEITGFNLNEPDGVLDTGMRDRDEFVYLHDFDFRNRNDAISMVSLALNNAITNAAIARWATQYFMSGAMPLLLVSLADDDPAMITEADGLKYKGLIERAWQGLWGKFALRAMFTDRKLDVQQAGIKADDVQAPELNQESLNAMTAVFQIAPDLIVPPPGGTQDRHKWLIMDAYNSSVLPVAWQMVGGINQDFGFDEHSPMRLVIDEESIRALEAERAENADTELQVFNGGLQTYGEAQERLKIRKPHEPLADWINVNGRFQSLERVLRSDKSPDDKFVQYGTTAFDSNIISLGEIRKLLFDLDTPPDLANKFKWQIIPDTTSGGMPVDKSGGANPPPALGAGKKPPELPPGGGAPSESPTAPPTSGNTPPAAPAKPPTGSGAEKKPAAGQPGAAAPKPAAPDKKKDELLEPEQPPSAMRFSETPNEFQAPPNTLEVVVVETTQTHPGEPPGALPVTEASQGQVLQTTPPAQEAPTELTVPHPAYACLWIGNDPLVNTALTQLQPLLENVPVEWSDPETWHITLVSGGDCSPAQMKSILQLTPAQCPSLHLRASGVGVFETPKGSYIVLLLDSNLELEGLQSAIKAAFMAQGIAISDYSAGSAYTPHITLGVAPDEADVPSFACNIVVEPQSLKIMRGDYEVVAERLPSNQALTNLKPADALEGVVDPVYNPNQRAEREQLWGDILRQRALMRSALEAWRTTGQPGPGLRDQVRSAVREAIASCNGDTSRAWLAINLACERGQFDADSDLEENPLIIPARAIQPSATDEIAAWEKYTLRGKTDHAFETLNLPMTIDAQIRAALTGATTAKAKREVFKKARLALAATQPHETHEDAMLAWAARLGENDNLSNLLGEA